MQPLLCRPLTMSLQPEQVAEVGHYSIQHVHKCYIVHVRVQDSQPPAQPAQPGAT